MKLSYAQRLEDYYLHLAFAGQANGFYVDIGAGEAKLDNVSYWFYLQGWSGLVVEPQDGLLSQYQTLRPRDRRDGRLIGRDNGTAEFYRFPELHGLSTMKPDAADAARAFEAAYESETRELVTLAALLDQHQVEHVDFLKIDVEGAEGDVLAGADWSRHRPRIILAEIVSPGQTHDRIPDWQALLEAQGYVFRLFDGLNRYYVAREETALMAGLPTTIERWDIVEHYWDRLQLAKLSDGS